MKGHATLLTEELQQSRMPPVNKGTRSSGQGAPEPQQAFKTAEDILLVLFHVFNVFRRRNIPASSGAAVPGSIKTTFETLLPPERACYDPNSC